MWGVVKKFDLNYNEKWVQVGQVPTACLAAVKLTYLLYFPSLGPHPQVHLLPAFTFPRGQFKAVWAITRLNQVSSF